MLLFQLPVKQEINKNKKIKDNKKLKKIKKLEQYKTSMLLNVFLQISPLNHEPKSFYRIVFFSAIAYTLLYAVCGSGILLILVFDSLVFSHRVQTFQKTNTRDYTEIGTGRHTRTGNSSSGTRAQQPVRFCTMTSSDPEPVVRVPRAAGGQSASVPELEDGHFTPFEHDIYDTFVATSNNLFKERVTSTRTQSSHKKKFRHIMNAGKKKCVPCTLRVEFIQKYPGVHDSHRCVTGTLHISDSTCCPIIPVLSAVL